MHFFYEAVYLLMYLCNIHVATLHQEDFYGFTHILTHFISVTIIVVGNGNPG